MFERVQNSARKRRQVQLNVIGQRRLDNIERHSKEMLRREVSRARWRAKEGTQPRDESVSAGPTPSGGPVNPLDSLNKLLASAAKKASG